MNTPKIKALFLALLGFTISFSAQAEDIKKVAGLKMPESAIAAKDGRVFVSEIGEFGKDGDGQITVIDKNGEYIYICTKSGIIIFQIGNRLDLFMINCLRCSCSSETFCQLVPLNCLKSQFSFVLRKSASQKTPAQSISSP